MAVCVKKSKEQYEFEACFSGGSILLLLPTRSLVVRTGANPSRTGTEIVQGV
jgi:hypothetical protein